MEKFRTVAQMFCAFVAKDWKALAVIGAIVFAIVIWLLTRDGIKPDESTGTITITTSNGEVISSGDEQNQGAENESIEKQ